MKFIASLSPLASLMLLASPGAVLASNGMNLLAQQVRPMGLAGAGSALLDDASALVVNPAGLAGLQGRHAAAALTSMNPRLHYTDGRGHASADVQARPVHPSLVWAQSQGAWAWGIGLQAQGGLGVAYESVRTPFGTTDRLESRIAHMKWVSALAWQVDERLRLGVALHWSQARMTLALFPQTSVALPGRQFSGMTIEGLRGEGRSVQLGLQYMQGPLQWSACYASATRLPLRAGQGTVNLTAQGAGRVAYGAEVEGLAWPQHLTLGVALRPAPDWRLALDYQWLDWSRSHQSLQLRLAQVTPARAPARIEQAMPLNWRDQQVIKAGVEWDVAPQWQLRAGWNWARRPMTEAEARPQLPAIAERHYTLGFGHRAGAWEWGLAYEHVPETRLQHQGLDPLGNPGGPGASTSLTQHALMLSLAYRH